MAMARRQTVPRAALLYFDIHLMMGSMEYNCYIVHWLQWETLRAM